MSDGTSETSENTTAINQTAQPKQRDHWDRAQILGQLMLPIVIAGFGFYIARQDQQHQDANLKTERVTNLLEHLASERNKPQLLALTVIKYLAGKNEVDGDLVSSIKGALLGGENISEEVVKASTEILEKVANGNGNEETKQSAKDALKQLSEDKIAKVAIAAKQVIANIHPESVASAPPTVYLQVQKDANRDLANNLQIKFKTNGLNAPGIEGVSKVNDKTEIRYFAGGVNTNADLEKIKNILDALGIKDAQKIDISADYPNSNAKPRHYEVWLGKNTNK